MRPNSAPNQPDEENVSSTATTMTDTPGATPAASHKRHRGWVNVSVRTKLVLIVLVGVVGGCLVGVVEARLNNQVWPLLIGMVLLAAGLISLVRRTVCEPLEDLLAAAHRSKRMQRPPERKRLPIKREDEIGELAALFRELSLEAYRHSTAVNRLRRTLDDRVAKSTQAATRQLEKLAMRDPLTNLGNRRFLDQHLGELVESCRESNTDLVCIAIDMDDFKAINDRFGHAVGDKMLTFLAQLIRANVRSEDYAVRLGGDEFVVLMPGANMQRARQFTQRVPALFTQQMKTMLPGDTTAGLSMGVASLRRDKVESGGELIERADDNLYNAKGNGKGQTCGT